MHTKTRPRSKFLKDVYKQDESLSLNYNLYYLANNKENLMSETVTKKIRILVEPEYLPHRSDPTKPVYFFAYHITITNESNKKTQLVSRYWQITDSSGNVEEIRGPGVVGKKPILAAGESFKYTSFCPLPTEFGVMRGSFLMLQDDGKEIDALIKPFKLAIPFSVN